MQIYFCDILAYPDKLAHYVFFIIPNTKSKRIKKVFSIKFLLYLDSAIFLLETEFKIKFRYLKSFLFELLLSLVQKVDLYSGKAYI